METSHIFPLEYFVGLSVAKAYVGFISEGNFEMHVKIYLLRRLIIEAPNPFVLPKLRHILIMSFTKTDEVQELSLRKFRVPTAHTSQHIEWDNQ